MLGLSSPQVLLLGGSPCLCSATMEMEIAVWCDTLLVQEAEESVNT